MNFRQPQDKVSSIKCHHPPGGTANFNLGWGNDQIKSTRSLQRSNSKTNFNIITGESLENKENVSTLNNSEVININLTDNGKTCMGDEGKKISIKTDYDTGKNQINLFGGSTPKSSKNKVSSIRVAQSPGGRSNVFFGDDTTSYNEYRKKR